MSSKHERGLQRVSRLSEQQISEIRQLAESGIPVYEIAPKFKITVRAISILLRNKKEKNPDHKYGRVQGEKVGTSKFTEQQVKEIRVMAQEGVSKSEIARRFNTTNQNIGQIVTRKTWKHVE
jgi:transcriptional regulator